MMRSSTHFLCVFALALVPLIGCGGTGDDSDGGTETEFIPDAPVTVSGMSPFAECNEDFDPKAMFTPNSEVEPWIVVNPTNPNHLAATWQQDKYFSGGGCRGQLASVTFDGGTTWESTTIPGLTLCSGGEWLRMTDPWLAFASNGDLYAASLSFRNFVFGGAILVTKSTDGGLTWGDPVTIEEPGAPFYNDKGSITTDPTDPCTVYATWSRFDSASGTSGSALFSRTPDCGETWTEPSVVHTSAPPPMGLQVLVLPDGSLRAFSVGWSGPNDWQVEFPLIVQQSTDQGDTWSAPVPIANVRRDPAYSPDSDARVRGGDRFFDAAVDRATGDLYAVWEQIFLVEEKPDQVAFSMSTDGGETWSTPTRIDQTPPASPAEMEQALVPSVEVSDEGILGVTYYNFENDTPNELPTETDYWFIHCDPQGRDCADRESWSEQVRLTPSSFDFSVAPDNVRGLFLGDYAGLTSFGADFFALFSVTTAEDPGNVIFVPIRGQ